jgi:D-aspartate ligase
MIKTSFITGEKIPAIVFGLFETGLGVIRSLGQQGIPVIGIDYKKDIGWYSRYVNPVLCPHPLQEEQKFTEWIHITFSGQKQKFPVFFTSDDFLFSFSRNREKLSNYFFFNLVDNLLLENISDKYNQYKLATEAGINMPLTWLIKRLSDFDILPDTIRFPLFIKGLDVNSWRKNISGTIKGFIVNDRQELRNHIEDIVRKDVPVILQEVIEGPDTNHYKYCSYTSASGEILGEFTLQKIRQNPIHFGVGAVVESIHKPELIELGRKLFSGIRFVGIGSAEFKLDNRDGRYKLIEINPRYWQQNYLSTACGINFPYLNYLDLLEELPDSIVKFKEDIKWVNRYMDFDSFLKYRQEKSIDFTNWRKSLKGKKVYSDFTWDDPLPVLYEIGFGRKLFLLPQYLTKRIFYKKH